MKSYQKEFAKFFEVSRQLLEEIGIHLITQKNYTESQAEEHLQVEGFELLKQILQPTLSRVNFP